MKKAVALVLAVVFATVLSGCGSQKQEVAKQAAKSNFPPKSIELVVSFAPGGVTDIAARILVNSVSKYLPNGQAVVVSNKPGDGTIVGMTDVYAAKADGYKVAFFRHAFVNSAALRQNNVYP